jgi:hypothetical protein
MSACHRDAKQRPGSKREWRAVAEHVVPLDLGVRWAPNYEHGVLTASEDGWAQLVLAAHLDDEDKRRVVFYWQHCAAARMEPPNDEAISGHRLYDSGLRDVYWVGEVLDSSLIADLERRNRVHVRHDPSRFASLRHWVLRLKGSVVEVVAESCEVFRTSD